MRKTTISVLYFSNESARGGAEEHILTLMRGLDRNVFRVHMVCPPELAGKLRPDLPADVDLVPVSLQRPTQVRAAWRLAQILRDRHVDILHSHLFYGSLFASPIGRLCRVPVILETPHVREQWRKGWLKSRYAVDRAVGRYVDAYIAVSEANARYLIEQKGLPPNKIKVIHNGCDLRRFEPSHRAPAELKPRLGFGADDPILAVLGRLEPQKGHRVLLQALPAVLREFPTVRLVCLGEGSLRSELEKQVRDLGLDGSVRFLGFQPNVADWLALAQMTILPSFYEGLPLVAIESLAAGRPVVATAVDGTPEVIVDGKTGLLVPPGDPERLAERICRLLRDEELRRALGHAGRQWVLSRFSEERQIQQTQELYLQTWLRRLHTAKVRTAIPLSESREGSEPRPPAEQSPRAPGNPVAAPCASRATQAAICEEARRWLTEQCGESLRAIVLTGSLARDEATVVERQGRSELLGDAEFLLVFHPTAALPAATQLDGFCQEIEGALLQRGTVCHVGVSAVHPNYLQNLKPHIFAYELRTSGQVVWGDTSILSLIPAFSPADIPLEDAWRLLCNRMIEQLELADELPDRPENLPPRVFYRTVKLYLDLATSYLLFVGAYEPSYRQRAEKLKQLASLEPSKDESPFSVARFAQQVSACTEIKLNGSHRSDSFVAEDLRELGFAFWEQAVQYAQLIWRWELATLTGTNVQTLSPELLRQWMQRQSLEQRLRGWLHVMRKQGWLRSWRHWPRWTRRAWKASPRYWIYAAASELFFRLPCLLRPAGQRPQVNGSWREIRSWLPVVGQVEKNTQRSDWQTLAADISWNYEQFLVGTRS